MKYTNKHYRILDINEKNIQKFLVEKLFQNNHILCANNVFINNNEADLISINRNLLLYEYEIKLSTSDYMNDFKNKKSKHNRQLKGFIDYPNYFYFVVPEGMIQRELVNNKYGLIEIAERKHSLIPYISKKPKKLHNTKIKRKTLIRITKSLSNKYWNGKTK